VLSALQEVAGFDAREADVLVGTSAGSLVAAALAGGLSAADQRAELLGEPLSAQGRATRARRVPVMPLAAPDPEPRRGPLAPQALLAGAAYVDGGAHSPSNADVLVRDRLERVLVLSPMTVGRGGSRRPRADLALRLAVRRYLALEVRALRRAGARVVVLQPGPHELPAMGLNPMQHSRIDGVLEAAAEATRRRLERQPDLLG
jgi:hypothetical protein